jgi:quercetin dioxygenase-like cupin family protein
MADAGAQVAAVHAVGLLEELHDRDLGEDSWRASLRDLVERTWCAPLARARCAHRVDLRDGHRVGTFALAQGRAARATMNSMSARPGAEAPPFATLVTSEAARALAWHKLDPFEGVDYKLLWRSGESVAGILRIAPGSSVSPHAHVRSQHHMWVIDGSAEMLHEHVGPGTYLHIPAGAEHGIGDVGDDGCTVLYLYLRDDDGTGRA